MSRILSNADVQLLIAQVPLAHTRRQLVCSLSYVDKHRVAVFQRRYGFETIFGETAFDSEAGTRIISVFRQRKDGNYDEHFMKTTILHEIGHCVFTEVATESKIAWYGIHDNSVVYLNRAGRDPEEDFADTYATCVLNPAVLGRMPERLTFMQKLMQGV
ncbi:MAG: hypothetical protein HYX90_08260 [Chloroflexi bacterium]|nr:hypothetical protein [Chloroflexota bacterium]